MKNEKNLLLIAMRERCNLTQTGLATRAGVSLPTVNRAELGHPISPASRELLCTFFCEHLNKQVGPAELGLLKENQSETQSSTPASTNVDANVILGGAESSTVSQATMQDLFKVFQQILALQGVEMDTPRRRFLEAFGLVGASMFSPNIGTGVATSILELFDPETEKRLSQSTIDPTSLDEKTLIKFEKVTVNCWLLLKFDGLPTVEQLLPTYLPQIITFAQKPSKFQERTARIAAQGYILKGLVAVLNSNLSESIQHCKRAVSFARIAKDLTLEAAALKHLATKYQDNGQPQQTLQSYLEVLPTINDVSPLLQGRTYLGLALAYAQIKQEKDALYYMDLAHASFPNSPEDDPGYSYADCNTSSLNHYGGLVHQEFEQFEKARETFAAVDTLSSKASVPERTRLEILNCQAEASLALRDLTSSRDLIEASARGAKKLDSEKRHNDAFGLYKQARLLWPREPQIRELAGLFQR